MRKSIKRVIVSALSAAMALSAAVMPTQKADADVLKEVSTVKSSSYRAYIVVQQGGTYVYRDHWYGNNNKTNVLNNKTVSYAPTNPDGSSGTASDVPYSPLLYLHHADLTDANNAILLKGPGTRVEITDALITGPGTYSVRIDIPEASANVFKCCQKEITCAETNSCFNMIGIATDIPRPDPKDLDAVPTVGTAKFTNVELYFDGKKIKSIAECTAENGGLANDSGVKFIARGVQTTGFTSGNYYTPMVFNTYDKESNTASVVRIRGDKSNAADFPEIKDVPTKSLEVRFTIDGDIFDPAGAASDSTDVLKQAIANAVAIDAGYQNKVNMGTTVNADGSFSTKVQTYDANLNAISAQTIGYSADGKVLGATAAAVTQTKNEAAKVTYTPDAVGTTFTANGNTYKVTKAATVSEDKTKVTGVGEVALTAVSNAKAVNSGAIVDNGNFSYNVTAINAKAFSKAKKATKIVVGAKVTTIGNNAFAGCNKLANMKIASKVLKKVQGKKTFKFKKAVTIKVPKAKKAAYTKLIKKAGGSANKIK